MGFIILFIFIAVIGGMVFAVIKTLKKTDQTMTGAVADSKTISTAQDFLPFDDIDNNMIDLGGFKYRMIVECSSTNYNLKTGSEKEMIEMAFQRFLNSLQFPVTFYIQTKEIDNSKMLSQLEGDIVDTLKIFPQLKDYGEIYFQEMKNLNLSIGNTKQKKKYIIIPYDEVSELTDLNNSEKYEYALKELSIRTSMVMDGLSAVGIKATHLKNPDLLELVYSIFHKDDYSNVEHLISGEYLKLTVEGENKLNNINDFQRADQILYQAQKMIKNEILIKALTEEDDGIFGALIERLQEIRDKVEEVEENRFNKKNVKEEEVI